MGVGKMGEVPHPDICLRSEHRLVIHGIATSMRHLTWSLRIERDPSLGCAPPQGSDFDPAQRVHGNDLVAAI